MTIEHGGLQRAALDAFAGAVAGGVSRTLVSPLDVIKIRFQVGLPCSSSAIHRLALLLLLMVV